MRGLPAANIGVGRKCLLTYMNIYDYIVSAKSHDIKYLEKEAPRVLGSAIRA